MRQVLCPRYIPLLMLLLFAQLSANAQFAMQLQQPHRQDFDFQLKGEVAMVYQSNNIVLGQEGEWNFRLAPAEEATVLSFGDGNQLLKAIWLRDDEQVGARMTLTYAKDDKEKLTTITEGKAIITFQYDRAGKPIEVESRFEERLTAQTFISYQRKGRSKEVVNLPGQSFRFERTLQGGQVIQFQRVDSVKGVEFEVNYTYNKEGWLTEENRAFIDDPSKARVRLTYTYRTDEKGNWIFRLEHNHANGQYRLRQRKIIYRDELDQITKQELPTGYWSCPTDGFFLEVQDDGFFTFFNLERGRIYRGTWGLREGGIVFRVNYEDNLGAPYALRTGRGLECNLSPGRLQLSAGGEYLYEFLSEDLMSIPERVRIGMKYERWSKNRYSDVPAQKAETAAPADIQAAFDEVRSISPDYFQACLGDQCGVVDREGRVIVPFAYERVSLTGVDLFHVVIDGKQGLIDKSGRELLPIKYDRIWAEPKLGDRVLGTRINGERYFYDVDAEDFLPFEKEDLRDFNATRRVLRKGRFVHLYDLDFNQLTTGDSYSRITVLTHDRYLAAGRDAYRLLNAAGEEIFVFDGFIKVQKGTFGYLTAYSATNQRYALFDYNGQQLTDALYSELTFCTSSRNKRDTNCDLLEYKPAVAKFKKPFAPAGYLTGLGQELR